MKKIYCENLDHQFELPEYPRRVISLVSCATEALFAMGCGDRVAGVSIYCARYVPGLAKPVAGDYFRIDEGRFKELKPDLVLVTTGVQRRLGLKLAKKGLPVYALPLPNSFYGILENNVTLGALMNEMIVGRLLCLQMQDNASAIGSRNSGTPPRVFVELWFGKDMCTIGGRTFIADLVSLAGGEPVYNDRHEGYFKPDLKEVENLRPEVLLFFSEPGYHIDIPMLLKERGWNRSLRNAQIVESTVKRGRNIIHDGPSFLETAAWLQKQLLKRNFGVKS